MAFVKVHRFVNELGDVEEDHEEVRPPQRRKRAHTQRDFTQYQLARQRNLAWMYLVDSKGFTIPQIAAFERVNLETVRKGVKNAKRILREARRIADDHEDGDD